MRLRVANIKKSFGAVQALKGVSLEVGDGLVHAIIGENGAGKSTLMKILSGAEKPDSGEIYLSDKKYRPAKPAEGRKAGISMVYQELNLANHLSVYQNMVLGLETSLLGIELPKRAQVKNCLKAVGLEGVKLSRSVGELSMAQRQLLEIARALMTDAKVVILDEPTSSLTGEDTQMLFKIIRELKAKGISILYISHFLEEVKAIADTYTVIRDGESVASGNMSEVSINRIIELMVGRSIEDIYPNLPAVHGECILKIRNLRGTDLPMSASFELHKGEIMGIAGLVGSGRTELLRALFGLDAIQSASVFEVGKIQVNHTRYRSATALKVGFDLLSENRKEEGLALNQSIAWNTTLSSLSQFGKWGFINLQKEAQTATEWKNKLQIKANTVETLAGNLSGGNQQKIALARILLYNNHLLLLDEPTRGIDVGSKVEIYRLIQEEAAKGKAIIMVSSYLPELLGVCHTLTVMHKGRLSPKRKIADWTEQEIMLYATSGTLNEENT